MTAAQILVVDDEAAVRESLRRALALEGYSVELATDGAEALNRLDTGDVQPDAIVLDVLMPNVDGLETARRRALLRRTTNGAGETLRFADLELDPSTREVTRDGEAIELTRTEFSLLELFMLNPRQVLTRSLIFERVWGYDFGLTSNSLDVYIGYLRRKTEAGRKPRLIQTVRGVGYALREP